ncbi:hypothetical protein ACP70R_027018 [Stipagrostis hirtigluma subsp. patula]
MQDDQIILTALLFYVVNAALLLAQGLPWWNSKGLVITALLHVGPVEFLYYWFHRALHHHYLYSRYHSHHHASIVTEPITSVIHPFAEELVYFTLFAIPLLTMVATSTASVAVANGYLIYIDFMNYLGHCNFEPVPKCLFDVFPPLKYLMYVHPIVSSTRCTTRSSAATTQLFMPLYDHLYGTVDKSRDDLYERTLHGRGDAAPDVVHLTHLAAPESLFHLRLGFASLGDWAARPLAGRTFRSEANRLGNLSIETWVVPRYTSQVIAIDGFQLEIYTSKESVYGVSRLIEKAVADAEASLLNKAAWSPEPAAYELNRNGELYVIRKNSLKTKIVDGMGPAWLSLPFCT